MGVAAGLALGGASLFGASKQSKAAKSAAELQAQAAQNATDTQLQMYNQSRADQMPWLQQGQKSLAQLAAMTHPGGELMRTYGQQDFQSDPGYQFRQAEAMKAVQRAMEARGLGNSGALFKNIADRSQQVAADEYQNAYSRWNQQRQQQYNMLAGLAGTGQSASNTLASLGKGYGEAAAQNMGQAANSVAAGQVAGANARQNALSDILGLGVMYGTKKGYF